MRFDAAVLERTECRFRRDIWSVAPEDAVLEAGIQARWFGPVLATVFAELPDIAGLNMIQGAAEPTAIADGHLGHAVDWIREWEVNFLVPIASGRPGTGPAESYLADHGYEQRAVTSKYVRPAAPPADSAPPPGIEVLELYADEGEGMHEIAADCYGLPSPAPILFYDLPALEHWRCYVALRDGELVACGSMAIDEGIATLGVDATLPHARGRGCNTALLNRRLHDAASANCEIVMAETLVPPGDRPSAATRNLIRAGFVEAYRTVSWQRPVRIRVVGE